jgi:hypothetical protein
MIDNDELQRRAAAVVTNADAEEVIRWIISQGVEEPAAREMLSVAVVGPKKAAL